MKNLIILILFMLLLIGADSSPVMRSKITGGNEQYDADVVLQSGVKRLATDAAISINNEILGQDPQGTTWFFFGSTLEDADGIGAVGDTVRVQIPAATTPLDTIYPAVDYTYTITSSDVASNNPERTVSINICSGLNGDTNFKTAKWKCIVARDFALVHIESTLYNEFGTRTSWGLTCSGSTVCNKGFSDIARRGKPTELARSPNDPRQGVLGISGTVKILPSAISQQFIINAKNGTSDELAINGSATPVDFLINCNNDFDTFIVEIRLWGAAHGIKFNKFLSRPTLSNGLEITIKSDDIIATIFPKIQKTEDFMRYLSRPPTNFDLYLKPGYDNVIGAYEFPNPFVIRKCGSYGTDDYIKVTVKDDLHRILSLKFIVSGFYKDL